MTRQERGKRTARKGAFLLGSIVLQVGLAAGLVALSARAARKAAPGPLVPVILARPGPASSSPAGHPAPPPPPPPRSHPVSPKPRLERPVRPTDPAPVVQPRSIPEALPPPQPEEPPPAGPDPGTEGGVEGGVAGGVAGGQPGGVVGGDPAGGGSSGGGGEIEDAPQYMTSGFRKPVEAQPGCVRSAMRVPPQLAGFISGPISVKFAVARDGRVGQVHLLTPVPDRRIEEVIGSALRACQWVPGADAQGRPIAIWVIMPIRFTASR